MEKCFPLNGVTENTGALILRARASREGPAVLAARGGGVGVAAIPSLRWGQCLQCVRGATRVTSELFIELLLSSNHLA